MKFESVIFTLFLLLFRDNGEAAAFICNIYYH